MYTYSGILLSPKKEGKCDTCYNMDEPRGHYAKEAGHKKECMIPLIWSTYSNQNHKHRV